MITQGNIDRLDIVSIYLIEGDNIVVKAQRGFAEDYISRAGRIPYPKGVTGKTAIEGKSKYIRRQVQEKWENAEV